MSTSYKLSTIPIAYRFADRPIPSTLNFRDCFHYLRGQGLNVQESTVMAMQNRASDVMLGLAVLISNSGDAELIRRAEKYLQQWNDDCSDFFANPFQ